MAPPQQRARHVDRHSRKSATRMQHCARDGVHNLRSIVSSRTDRAAATAQHGGHLREPLRAVAVCRIMSAIAASHARALTADAERHRCAIILEVGNDEAAFA